MSEASFQSAVLKYLNSLEGCCAENVSGNAQQSGRADINGVYKGKSFRIELKILDRNNKPTHKQIVNLIRWFKNGSAICVAYTMQDIKTFMFNLQLTKVPWNKIYSKNCCSFGYYTEDIYASDFFKEYKQLYIQN